MEYRISLADDHIEMAWRPQDVWLDGGRLMPAWLNR